MGRKLEKQFQHLFKLHYEPLCLFVMNYVKDKDQAEDIVQAVFSSLWSKKDRLDWGDKITHYLYKAAKNNALDHIRKHKHETRVEDAFFDDISAEGSFSKDSIESIQLILVKKAIQTLPPRCREVFTLQKMSGMTYKEIAEDMGISVKTVENQMIKALAMIREFYTNHKDKYGI